MRDSYERREQVSELHNWEYLRPLTGPCHGWFAAGLVTFGKD
jgi:hypothetical protein